MHNLETSPCSLKKSFYFGLKVIIIIFSDIVQFSKKINYDFLFKTVQLLKEFDWFLILNISGHSDAIEYFLDIFKQFGGWPVLSEGASWTGVQFDWLRVFEELKRRDLMVPFPVDVIDQYGIHVSYFSLAEILIISELITKYFFLDQISEGFGVYWSGQEWKVRKNGQFGGEFWRKRRYC